MPIKKELAHFGIVGITQGDLENQWQKAQPGAGSEGLLPMEGRAVSGCCGGLTENATDAYNGKETDWTVLTRMGKTAASIAISTLLVLQVLVAPAFAAAPTVTTSLLDSIFAGVETDFTVTTTTGDVPGTMVKAVFEVKRSGITAGDLDLRYQETAEDGDPYLPLPLTAAGSQLTGEYGPPETGFPLIDGTSHFKVTFETPGVYDFAIRIVRVADGTELAEVSRSLTVESPDPTVTTNLPERILDEKEISFTVTTTPGDMEAMVMAVFEITGTGLTPEHFSLKYKEVNDGKYYDLPLTAESETKLTGEFGPETGFPLGNVTADFKVTPHVTGTYNVTISILPVGGSETLASLDQDLQVVDTKPTITLSIPSEIKVDTRKSFDVDPDPGDFANTDVYLSFTIERNNIDDDDLDIWYEDDDEYEGMDLDEDDDEVTAIYDPDGNGFPLTSSDLKFRIEFDRTGDYEVNVSLHRAGTGEVLDTDSEDVDVYDPEDEDEDDSGSSSGSSGSSGGSSGGSSSSSDSTGSTSGSAGAGSSGSTGTGTSAGSTGAGNNPGPSTPAGTAAIPDNNAHGTTTAEASSTGAAVTHQVTAAPTTGDLSIDLSSSTVPVAGQSTPVTARTAVVPAAVASQLNEGQDLVLRTGVAELEIPSAALRGMAAAQGGPDAEVRISVQAIDPADSASSTVPSLGTAIALAQAGGLRSAGQILVFQAAVRDESVETPVTTFNTPITVRIPFTGAMNPEHVGVYRLNRATGEWDYVGGRVNTVGRYVEVELSGFSEYTVFEYTRSFWDVDFTHWAKSDIELMAARHIVKGDESGFFNPEGNVSRGEFVAMLVRSLKLKPISPFGVSFSDVAFNSWYHSDLETAAQYGLISASDGHFRPEDPINRQEMAVMLANALVVRGVPQANVDVASALERYADQDSIADWAAPAVARMTRLGIMNGKPQGFAPLATATRAEAVTVLKRLLTLTGEL